MMLSWRSHGAFMVVLHVWSMLSDGVIAIPLICAWSNIVTPTLLAGKNL